MMTTSTAFAPRSHDPAGSDRMLGAGRAFGKILLTIRSRLRDWSSDLDERRQFESLDLRGLDDIGLTRADRDLLLKR